MGSRWAVHGQSMGSRWAVDGQMESTAMGSLPHAMGNRTATDVRWAADGQGDPPVAMSQFIFPPFAYGYGPPPPVHYAMSQNLNLNLAEPDSPKSKVNMVQATLDSMKFYDKGTKCIQPFKLKPNFEMIIAASDVRLLKARASIITDLKEAVLKFREKETSKATHLLLDSALYKK